MFTVDTRMINFQPLRKWEKVLFFAFVFAILLPTAPQASLTALTTFWFLYQKGWKVVLSALNGALNKELLKILAVCITISALMHILCFLGEFASDQSTWPQALGERGRLIGKQGLWGFFMIMSLQFAYIRGFRLSHLAKPLFIGVVLLALYMLAQRYWGIDWVHGFSAKIPDNRYAFGVYRGAGFMAHPLSFAYNAGLFSLMSLGIGLIDGKKSRSSPYWYGCAVFGLICLLLSNSRWPAVLCVAGMVSFLLLYRKRLPQGKYFLFGVALALIFTGFSLKDRVMEFTHDSRPLVTKMPRLVFWQVHVELFKDHPLFGVDYVNKEAAAVEQYDIMGYNKFERKYSAHNIYLQTLADSGVVGFVGLMALLGGLTFASKKFYASRKNPLLAMIIAYTIFGGLMQNNLRDSEYLFALWLTVGLASILDRDSNVATGSKI